MKIVTWNCNGALRRKLEKADDLDADVLVIQECENPALSDDRYLQWAGNYLWCGEEKNKGIGIFPKKGNKVSRLDWHGQFSMKGLASTSSSICWSTSDLRSFLPFVLNDQLTVLAVWTKGSSNEVFGYIGQLWKYLQIHGRQLSGPATLVVGDLNSNAIWDKADRWWSHSGIVAELAELGLSSLYHLSTNQSQGNETKPTFYLQRNLNKPYHIDYAFASKDLAQSADLVVGDSSDWLHVSDHMPLVITIPV